MTSRNIGRLSNTKIQRYIGGYDVDGNNNFPMTEPHPRLIQTDPASLRCRTTCPVFRLQVQTASTRV
ncbi:hypothetical protein DM01DRAFT_1336809 [Hesseltinella vesiculosa]|uniref:Uncharacterized protein n=1 Tax=Hesseltinella vesiculosa TaxID=101127 RepID=A0A1X2GFC1_9FUNG|nr:hypothetical protein DM01DRAFT_1336809 [Hesseltinella vesiculosa]